MRADDIRKEIDAESSEGGSVVRALRHCPQPDPDFRNDLRKRFAAECRKDAARHSSRRVRRIPTAYLGFAAAAVIALALGVGSLMRPAPTPAPGGPELYSMDKSVYETPTPDALGFGPNTRGRTDTARLTCVSALDDQAVAELDGIAVEAGGRLEIDESNAEASIEVDRNVANHVISRLCEDLGAEVEQPLSDAGSTTVTVEVQFSSN